MFKLRSYLLSAVLQGGEELAQAMSARSMYPDDLRALRRGSERAEYGGLQAFDPMKVDADELNSFMVDAIDAGLIEVKERGTIGIYPQAVADPSPVVAVQVGALPVALGGEVGFQVAEGAAQVQQTLEVVGHIVDEANVIAGSLPDPEAARAAERIAAQVPRLDSWRSAASFMEHAAETLDIYGVQRPDHYAEEG